MGVFIIFLLYINIDAATAGLRLDFKNRRLSSVPMHLSTSVHHLDLSNNKISNLTHEVFKGMFNLQSLDLSCNKLHGLPVDIFHSLFNLSELNVSFNWLDVSYAGLPRGVFRKQSLCLRVLKLTTLAVVGDWAVDSLADLQALEELHLNFPAKATQFPLQIAQLPKLRLLNMQCNDVPVGPLSAKWLHPLKQSSLQELSLQRCFLSYLEPGLFADFARLGVLNLACTAMDDTLLDNVTHALSFLGHTPLETLILDGASKQMAWLRPHNICNDIGHTVKQFSIKYNNIAFFQLDMLTCFDQIRSLSVAFNPFLPIAKYPDLNNVWPLFPATLELVDMSYTLTSTYSYTFKKEFCSQNKIFTPAHFFRDATANLVNITHMEPKISKPHFKNKTHFKMANLSSSNFPILKYVYWENMIITIFENPIGVHVVNASRSGPYTGIFVMFLVYGLNSLQILDLSYTYSWDETFDLSSLDSFDPYPQYPSLRILNIAGNYLVHYIPFLPKLLKNMPRLEELDLSSNKIQILTRDLLMHCQSLRKLSLAYNLLTSEKESFHLAGIQSLTYLDLTGNGLVSIPTSLISWDHLSTSNTLTLVLDHNPLKCDCSSLKALEFLAKSNITIFGEQNLRCILTSVVKNISFDSSSISLMDINAFKAECSGVGAVHKIFRPLAAGLGVVMLVLISLSVIMLHKFRLQLRVCYYRFRLSNQRNHKISEDSKEYRICIVYSENSEQDTHFIVTTIRPILEQEGCSLFIFGINDQAGTSRYEEIYRGICSSEKVIMLLTDDFLNDPWCDFAVEVARSKVPKQNICILCSSKVNIAKITTQPLKTIVQSPYTSCVRFNCLGDQGDIADRLRHFASDGEDIQCLHF